MTTFVFILQGTKLVFGRTVVCFRLLWEIREFGDLEGMVILNSGSNLLV